MWRAARRQGKKLEKAMDRAKARAEARKADLEKKMSDPVQFLRITGMTCKTYLDAEQHYFHEDATNLMPWQGDIETRVDRFDGRNLLDILPPLREGVPDADELDLEQELQFERYRDLVENERLEVEEEDRLQQIDEEWTDLLKHQKEMDAMVANKAAQNYWSSGGVDAGQAFRKGLLDEDDLLHETDILEYVDDLTEAAQSKLNQDATEYGITNYCRMLRSAKRERDEKIIEAIAHKKVKEIKEKSQGLTKEERSKGRRERRLERERARSNRYISTRRDSPTYEPYGDSYCPGSESEGSGSPDSEGFVIEVGGQKIDISGSDQNCLEGGRTRGQRNGDSTKQSRHLPSEKKTALADSQPTKKMTAAEKLKSKLQARLSKQIQQDEKKKLQKQQEKEIADLISEGEKFSKPMPTTHTGSLRRLRSRSPAAERGEQRARRLENSPCYRYPSRSRSRSRSRRRSRSISREWEKRSLPGSNRRRSYSPSPERRRNRRRGRSRSMEGRAAGKNGKRRPSWSYSSCSSASPRSRRGCDRRRNRGSDYRRKYQPSYSDSQGLTKSLSDTRERDRRESDSRRLRRRSSVSHYQSGRYRSPSYPRRREHVERSRTSSRSRSVSPRSKGRTQYYGRDRRSSGNSTAPVKVVV